MTVTPPNENLVHVGFINGATPIFRLRDGSEPRPSHPELVYQHHNHHGDPVFRQRPRSNPHLHGAPITRPLYKRVQFGVEDRHSTTRWPDAGWTPLCERAERTIEYYAKHRGDPRLPKQAWNEVTDMLNEIEEIAPVDPTSLHALAQSNVECATRSRLDRLPGRADQIPIAGHVANRVNRDAKGGITGPGKKMPSNE
jgi:hypothetical protein